MHPHDCGFRIGVLPNCIEKVMRILNQAKNKKKNIFNENLQKNNEDVALEL